MTTNYTSIPLQSIAHGNTTGQGTGDHHTATVAGDLDLADLNTRAHANLSDAPTSAHHVRYSNAEALAAVEAAAELTIQGQITFPATQSASAGAHVLDDYEEGTWTPALTFGGGNSNLATSATNGSYVKIGKVVFWAMELILTSNGDSTGVAIISGLPFTSASNPSGFGASENYIEGCSFADQTFWRVNGGGTTIACNEINNAGATSGLTQANIADNMNLQLGGVYFV